MSRVSGITVLSLCAVLSLTRTVTAQTTNATIVGDVTDAQGGRIVGAAIQVRNSATGVVRELKTDEQGSYRVFPLNPGTYEITASIAGFKTQTQQNVVL